MQNQKLSKAQRRNIHQINLQITENEMQAFKKIEKKIDCNIPYYNPLYSYKTRLKANIKYY